MLQEIKLSEPTIFPDLNKQEAKDVNFAREILRVEKLKYKHIRLALKHPEADQMHHLMMLLTNLTENDIGELSPQDAASLTLALHQALLQFNQPNQKTG